MKDEAAARLVGIGVKVIDALGVKAGAAADYAVDGVALGE